MSGCQYWAFVWMVLGFAGFLFAALGASNMYQMGRRHERENRDG